MNGELKILGTWKVRDCHDGLWWTIELRGFCANPTSKPSSFEVWSVLDGVAHVKHAETSRRKAEKQIDRAIALISGRRFKGRWIVCEADRVPEGYENSPWPGPCERTFLGGRMPTGKATAAAQARLDYEVNKTMLDLKREFGK